MPQIGAKKSNAGEAKEATPNLIEEQAKEKQEHRQKILDFVAQGGLETKIKNDDIQKLLGVSDATAERYLNELEKEGVLKQVGGEGRSVFYQKA